ncbi:MAG: hypothetical protein PHX83_05340 [Acidobacteriia bacterium]|nr:hypothetical protein [Terriglobia bacterium]
MFRRPTGLGVLAILLFSSSFISFAQAVPHFILSGTTTLIRQHGQAEVLGDLTLTCTVAGTFPASSSFAVFYSPIFSIVNAADVTNSFVVTSGVPQDARVGYVESEGSSGITIGNATLGVGDATSLNIRISGSAAVGDIIRVLGIRVNVGETQDPVRTQVQAFVFGNPPNAFQIDNTNTFPVAFTQDEMTVGIVDANPIAVCFPGSSGTGFVNVTEVFAGAFSSAADENDLQHKPSSPSAKAASFGTQVKITIINLLPGVRVSVNPTVVGTDGILKLNLAGGSPSSFTDTSTSNPITVTFVYEVVADDPLNIEQARIPLTFTNVAVPYPPVLGNMFAKVMLGPNAGVQFKSTIPSTDILSFANVPILGDDPPNLVLEPFAPTILRRTESGGTHHERLSGPAPLTPNN